MNAAMSLLLVGFADCFSGAPGRRQALGWMSQDEDVCINSCAQLK